MFKCVKKAERGGEGMRGGEMCMNVCVMCKEGRIQVELHRCSYSLEITTNCVPNLVSLSSPVDQHLVLHVN